MKLQFFRIFIAQSSQLSLLADTTITKGELISEAFGQQEEPMYYTSGESEYAYVVHKKTGNYIYASLAKKGRVKIQHSPEEDFEIEAVDTWPRVPLLINTDSDPENGQSIAIELNGSIFQHPHVQIRILVSELNKTILKRKGYEMAIHPISEQNEFWDVVSRFEGSINSLEFEFSAPNLFNSTDSLNDELRDARDHFGMTKASIKVENSDGELRVPSDNNFIKQGVNYITEGGGEYKIKLKNRNIITGADSIKSKEINETELEIAASNKETLKEFCDTLFSWLKH